METAAAHAAGHAGPQGKILACAAILARLLSDALPKKCCVGGQHAAPLG